MSGFLTGYGLGLSLIVAIGAQNAFVLKQGLMRQHVFWVCLVCAVSDAILIFIGIYGLSLVAKIIPNIGIIMRYIGAVFLFCYGLRSFWLVYSSNNSLIISGNNTQPLKVAILTCIMFTWLNPHVYLDTVFLVGTIAANYPDQRLYFGMGAVLASFSFFFSLGYGASLLRPIFAKPLAWKILDFLIGVIMWLIAINLLRV